MENVGESVEIELFTKKSSPETKYIAVGFSEDVSMVSTFSPQTPFKIVSGRRLCHLLCRQPCWASRGSFGE